MYKSTDTILLSIYKTHTLLKLILTPFRTVCTCTPGMYTVSTTRETNTTPKGAHQYNSTIRSFSHSLGASQQNGLLQATSLSLSMVSVSVALNSRVCLFLGRRSNITSSASSKLGSRRRSASSRTWGAERRGQLLLEYRAIYW